MAESTSFLFSDYFKMMNECESKDSDGKYNDEEIWLIRCYASCTKPDALETESTRHDMKNTHLKELKPDGNVDIYHSASNTRVELWGHETRRSNDSTYMWCEQITAEESWTAVGWLLIDQYHEFGMKVGVWKNYLPLKEGKELLSDVGLMVNGQRHGEWTFYFYNNQDILALPGITTTWYHAGSPMNKFNVLQYIRILLLAFIGRDLNLIVIDYLRDSSVLDISVLLAGCTDLDITEACKLLTQL